MTSFTLKISVKESFHDIFKKTLTLPVLKYLDPVYLVETMQLHACIYHAMVNAVYRNF